MEVLRAEGAVYRAEANPSITGTIGPYSGARLRSFEFAMAGAEVSLPHFEACCIGSTSRNLLEYGFATRPLRIFWGVTSVWL
jgi:hypothetical protein